MTSKGTIFINLQLCRDLNVPIQQLIDRALIEKEKNATQLS